MDGVQGHGAAAGYAGSPSYLITAASLTTQPLGGAWLQDGVQGHGTAAVCAGSPSYLITAASQATPPAMGKAAFFLDRGLYIVASPLLGPSLP